MRNNSSTRCMTWKTACFVRPHIDEKQVFLNLLPGGPFWETCVSGARKRRLRVNGRLKGRTKNPFPKWSRFKDIHTCARGNTDVLIGHFRVPGPLFQNEVKCSAFDMQMIFHSHANKTHFHKKGCALGLILKVRVLELGSGPLLRDKTSPIETRIL